jgi:hypothetical protein
VSGADVSRSPTGTRNAGRPATGSIVWVDPKTQTIPRGVRVTRANGKREVVPFKPGTTREAALALAPVVAAQARHAVGENEGETVSGYAARWCKWRETRGVNTVAKEQSHLKYHIDPIIGMLPIQQDASTLRAELKKFVAALDVVARRGFTERDGHRFAFSTKTAINV